MIELYRCERMHASISKAQCDANRNGIRTAKVFRAPCLSCSDCPGLGDPVEMQIKKEVEDMARQKVSEFKKGDKFICPGCGKEKIYEAGGFCGVCNKQKRKANKITAPTPPSETPVQVNEHPVDNAALPDAFGKVTNGDGDLVQFGVDPLILQALDDAWMQKRTDWLVELSGVNPGPAVCRTALMVKAIEGLGY